VAAYQSAVEEQTRERVPLDWAMTQTNLGNALQVLGAREGRHGAGWRRRWHPTGRRWREITRRAGAAPVGDDTDEPRQRAPGARFARGGHGARLEEAVAAFDAFLTAVASALPEAWVQDVRRRREATLAELTRRSSK
jgi:hypothetical protein